MDRESRRSHDRTPQLNADVAWRWLPFGLLPSDQAVGRLFPEIHELRLPAGETDWLAAIQAGTVETLQRRPIDDVLKHFAMQAVTNHYAAGEFAAGTRPVRASRDELQQWIAHTHAMADRLPFVGLWCDQMHAVAASLERYLQWPARFFTHSPAVDTKADANFRASLNLWALDQLMRAMNESEPVYAMWQEHETGQEYVGLKIPPTKFWPGMFDWVPRERVDPAFADYRVAHMRVQRLDLTIKPGLRNLLMTELLAEAMHSAVISPSEPPKYAPDVH